MAAFRALTDSRAPRFWTTTVGMRAALFGVLLAATACRRSTPDCPPQVAPAPCPPAAAAAAEAAKPTPPTPVTPTPELAGPMAKLGFIRGVWRGTATGMTPDGKPYKVTQTERMGPMLGGDVLVIEGRGYNDDGTTGFNAFATLSWNQATSKYEMRSHAQGHVGTFEMTLTADGYVWSVPAGPDAIVRFTATVTPTHWREVGEYIAGTKPPMPMFEMNLDKVGDTDWPLGTPITPTYPPKP